LPFRVTQQRPQPVLFVPRIILVLLFLLIFVHFFRTILLPEHENFIFFMFGILPARYHPDVLQAFPGGVWSAIPTFLSYSLLHADFMHLTINSLWLLAFGSMMARILGAGRFLVLYLACALAAGLAHVIVDSSSLIPMVGASGAISGTMGAGFRALPSIPGFAQTPMEDASGSSPPLPLLSLTDRRFLLISGVWLATNMLFGLTGIRIGEDVLMIAWDAHVAGFVTGALLIGIMTRG
jgi:membrane associated rhomboid family serine protease